MSEKMDPIRDAYLPQVVDYEESGESEFVVADVPTIVRRGQSYDVLIDMRTREVVGFRWRTSPPADTSGTTPDRGFAGDSSGGLSNLSAAQGEMETTAAERKYWRENINGNGNRASFTARILRDHDRLLASVDAARRERDEAREAAYCGEEHDDGTPMLWEDKYVTANVGRVLNLQRAEAAEAALDAARKAEREAVVAWLRAHHKPGEILKRNTIVLLDAANAIEHRHHLPAARSTKENNVSDTTSLIDRLTNRFLAWKLPDNFNPDGGISFKRTYNEHTAWPMKHEPTGTNLLDYTQAQQMFEYLLADEPTLPAVRSTEHSDPLLVAVTHLNSLYELCQQHGLKSDRLDAAGSFLANVHYEEQP